jgi:hypothetical protein
MPLEIEVSTTFEQFIAEWNLKSEHPRTREMYEESISAAKVLASLSLPACPAWCGRPEGHGYEFDGGRSADFLRRHASRDDNGPQVQQMEHNYAGERIAYDSAEIGVTVGLESFSAEGARALAAQLAAAADLLDAINGAQA